MKNQSKKCREKGPYRWIILISYSFLNCFTWGSLYGSGLLYSSWSHEFTSWSKAFVSLVGSLPVAIGCGLGPIYGAIIQRYGYRKSAFFGGLIMSSGFITSSFQSDMIGLFVTYGLITGFGAGLANYSGSNAANEYFVKDRLIAEGVSGAFLSLGVFVVTEMIHVCTDLYTWRGATLISGAVHLNLCVFGLLLLTPDQVDHHQLNLFKNKKVNEIPLQNCQDIEEKISESFNEKLVVKDSENNIVETKQLIDTENEEIVQNQTEQKESMMSFCIRLMKAWRLATFNVLVISDCLTWTAMLVPYIHLFERTRLLGFDENLSAWISSVNGIGGIVGKIILSFIFYRLKIHPFYAFGINQVLIGLITILSPFWSTVEGLFFFSFSFGFLSGGYGFMKTSVAQMLGYKNFNAYFSWFLLLEGLGLALGPMFGGWLFSITQSYVATFLFTGSLLLVSGLFAAFKNVAIKFDERLNTVTPKAMTETC